jgi:hypothetical protein
MQEQIPGSGNPLAQKDRSETDKKPDLEKEARSREVRGMAIEELIRDARTPDQVLLGTRLLMRNYEDFRFDPEGGGTEYDMRRPFWAAKDREAALSLSIRDLIDHGIIKKLNDDSTGDSAVGGFALYEERKQFPKLSSFQVDPATKQPKLEGAMYSMVEMEVPYYGNDNERAKMREAYTTAIAEMKVRASIHELYKSYTGNIENIDGLANFYLYMLPFASGEKVFYNLPELSNGIKETATGVGFREGKEFGDKVDTSMRLFEVVALSEKPELLKKLMERPGFRQFLFPNDKAVRDWIGDVSGWARETQEVERVDISGKVDFKLIAGERNGKLNVIKERASRGKLTKYGNIFLEAISLEDFSKGGLGSGLIKPDGEANRVEEEAQKNGFKTSQHEQMQEIKEMVVKFLGGDATARDAMEEGWKRFKLYWTASEYGYEIYVPGLPDPKELGEVEYPKTAVDLVANRTYEGTPFKGFIIKTDMGGETSDDTVKVLRPDLFQAVYASKGRDMGPSGSLFKNHRFSISFMKYNTKGEGRDRRSWWELMWGAKAEGSLPEEAPKRIGELPWDENYKINNKFYLSTFMGGRKEIGSFQNMTNTGVDLRALTDQGYFRKIWKYLGIGLSDAVYAKGIFRGKDPNDIKNQAGFYRADIMKNIMDGIKSLSQYQDLLAEESRDYEVILPGGGRKKEALKPHVRINNIAGESGFKLE